MASIRDVAKQAGVSVATVSRTFRTPELLTEQTQRRVLDAARQLSYTPPVPSSAAGASKPVRSTRQHRPAMPATRSLGFLFFANVPHQLELPHSFYAPVLAGAQIETASLGMHLLVHTTDVRDATPPLMAVERAVDGMLLVGAVDRRIVDRFAQYIRHVVLVDNRDDTHRYESVSPDGFSGGVAAIQYLISLGHRRIAFLAARPGVPTFHDRQRGYWCGLLESGIIPDPSLVIVPESGDDAFPLVADRLLNRLKMPDPPTALLAANDSLAVYIIRVLQAEGIRVPEDISIIGCDDLPLATAIYPPLTTLRVDREAMGRLAVQRLIALIRPDSPENKAGLPPGQHQLPATLVMRGTCRPART